MHVRIFDDLKRGEDTALSRTLEKPTNKALEPLGSEAQIRHDILRSRQANDD